MFKKIVKLFGLFVLISRLSASLVFFVFEFIWGKYRLGRYLTPTLILLFIGINLINWQLWQTKSNPKIVVSPALSQNPGEELLELDQTTWQIMKNNYLKFNQQQSNSRDLNFNLGKILELENKKAAAEKFSTAAQLDPNYP